MSTVQTARATHPLIGRAVKVLRTEGRGAVADSLMQQAATDRPSLPSVLIAGEDKRGKSSLLNALVGVPDLSPIGVEVVTGAPISLQHSVERRAAILRYGESTPVPVEFTEAQRLATVQGNPGNEANIRMVQLGLPHPLLQRLLLVDTPGVGGLNSGHGELTLQSLAFADALMFVIEAGAQFRNAELQFLRRASARIDTVILVLTKIDKHRGWRSILDDNLAILREQAPRFASCPVVPVSSLLALQAVTCGDPVEAEDLRDESGIDRLTEVLGTFVVDRSAVLHQANQLRGLVPPLVAAERTIAEKQAAAAPDGEARRALEAEQQRLKEFNSDRADWQRRLDTGVRRITLQRQEDVNLGIVEVRRRYEERLKKELKKADEESLPGELVADLTALAGRLNEDSAKRLTDLIVALLDDIDAVNTLRPAIEQLTADRVSGQLAGVELGSHSLSRYEKLTLVTSFASGRSISGLLTGGGLGLSAGALIAPPVGIAIGIGLGGIYAFQAFRGRKRALFQQEFRQWMGAQCTQTQTTVNTTFAREVIDLQEEMREVVRQALAEREAEITEALAETKRLMQAEATQRAAAAEQLKRRRQEVRAVLADVQAELARLRPDGVVAPAGT